MPRPFQKLTTLIRRATAPAESDARKEIERRKAAEQLARDLSEIEVFEAVEKRGYWWPGEE